MGKDVLVKVAGVVRRLRERAERYTDELPSQFTAGAAAALLSFAEELEESAVIELLLDDGRAKA